MKTRAFAILFVLFSLCGLAAAQHDNCCGIDRQCSTDRQWTDGYYAFQRGQCAAPAQAQPPAPAASSSAPTDNCCGIDRQCYNDADWVVGFYAFRENQCAASTAGQQTSAAISQTRTQVWTPNMTEGVKQLLANPTTDPFNNCCYMHHNNFTCQSDADWARGWTQYQQGQCVHPAPLGTMPAIVGNDSALGTAKFHKLVNTALDLMRAHVPEWVDYIKLSGARQFELLPADVGGGFFNQSWVVGHGYYSWQQDDPNWEPNADYVVGYAGGITHEACHAIQQRTYTQMVGHANELPCMEAQLAVIAGIKPDSKDVGWLSDAVGHPDSWRR